MICPPCGNQKHEECRWPHTCPCQHVPSENVQIAEAEKPEKIFRNISEEPEASKPLDMDALTRMFSAVAHLQA